MEDRAPTMREIGRRGGRKTAARGSEYMRTIAARSQALHPVSRERLREIARKAIADRMANGWDPRTIDRRTRALPGLRARRIAAGLTEQELTRKAGLSPGVVGRIEAGTTASRATVAKLAAALGVDERVLLGG